MFNLRGRIAERPIDEVGNQDATGARASIGLRAARATLLHTVPGGHMFRYWVRLMALGGHHPWRQHDQFNGLSEPASPSLRELGARMCSIVGAPGQNNRRHLPIAPADGERDAGG
jgi:hypothetical protein